MLAAALGYDQIVTLLVRKGAIIDSKANDGRTALLTAVSYEHETTTRLLLDSGAALDLTDVHGRAPLSYAAAGFACCRGEAIVRLLVERGATIDSTDHDGRSPLLHAAESRRWESVKLLLEKGISINSRDNNGRSPLSCAAEDGNGEFVRYPLEAGADTESIDSEGRTPLYLAVFEAVHSLLLEIKLSNPEFPQHTPRVLPTKWGYIQNIKFILEQADKSSWPSGKRPSMVLFWRHQEVVLRLLEYGSDPEKGNFVVDGMNAVLPFALKNWMEDRECISLRKD